MSQSKNKLLTKLLNNATVKYITPGEDGFTEETHSETKRKGDSPLGEDKPVIYINSLKYKTPSQQQKMIAGEAIHLLKDVDPKRHKRMMDAAKKDPAYMAWAKRSYKYLSGDIPDQEGNFYQGKLETRNFEDWHNISRFDQVIGGYIFGQDPDLPTMKNWFPKTLPIQSELREELESFRKDFEQPFIKNPYWEKRNKAKSANTFVEAIE
jgi:hypothetical protein